jgi:type VI secretion system protein VasD
MPRILLFTLALLLGACASDPPPPPPTLVELTLMASDQLNPTPLGSAAPLRVKLYQLKGTATFDRADFFALFDKASATLGAELVEEEELLVRPGETLALQREMDSTAGYLGVVAGFRDLDRAVWRRAVAVVPQQTSRMIITFDARSVVIAPAPIPAAK